MPKIVYVGKETFQLGKTLWEIVGNLKDYGVGRLVTRHQFNRYPEPCFDKIIKIETEALLRRSGEHHKRRVIAWVERVFRGQKYPQLIELFSASYKPDFHLIPKDEEEIWYKRMEECSKPACKIFDPFVELPPLLNLILKEEKKAKGEPVEEVIKTPLLLKLNIRKNARLAEDGETPTHFVPMGFGKPTSPQLFDNIEACRPFFENRNPWLDMGAYLLRRANREDS